jgi:hypothetical protein
MKYLEHITFCELAVLWSVAFILMILVVRQFVPTLVTVVEKEYWLFDKQKICIQILGILHHLVFVKETSCVGHMV